MPKISPCIIEGCTKRRVYNEYGESKPTHCGTHKTPSMICNYQLCKYTGCLIRKSFGFPGEKSTYCSEHKLAGMINVIVKRCAEAGCEESATHNTPSESAGLYCMLHKKETMVRIYSEYCLFTGCKIRPSFNNPGSKKGLYCDSHKLEGMVNVKTPKCIEPSCSIYPTYNYPGNTKVLYCSSHKKEGMITIAENRKCEFPGCTTRPSYGIDKLIYCAKHKQPGMKSMTGDICTYSGCLTRASYNIPSKKHGIYCLEHKLEGMINIKDHKCSESGCNKIPSFNYEGKKKGLYCGTHRKTEMINVREKTCKTPHCLTQIADKYDGYCLHCYMHIYPDRPVCRNYKTKEKSVCDFIKEIYPTLSWSFDKSIFKSISRRRPDAYIDMGSYLIIVEIDENQHTYYDCTCENKRLMELSQDVGHKPIVFIRFNPDEYIDMSNNTIKSCWSIDGNSMYRVFPENKPLWEGRLNNLKEHIDYWIHNKVEKTIEVIQLYYDQNI